jgi:hypothetical protein
MDLAAYIDGTMSRGARAELEAHLAGCEACRLEVLQVDGILRAAPVMRRRALLPLGALAAAAVLLLVLLPTRRTSAPGDAHRDPAVTATVAPAAIEPRGGIAELGQFTWSSVPEATRYSVRLFDARGAVIWEGEPTDTTIGVPTSVRLVSGERYFWSVRARTGWGRWVESPLTEFVVQPSGSRP